jgi:dinuclear metal center YbgI/SA1388 family protein
MPVQLRRVIECLEGLAPPELAEPWDTVGLQIGAPEDEIGRVLLTVDVIRQVVDEAMRKDAGAIIAHHPVLFGETASLRRDRWPGCVVAPLIEARRALYVAHTNLDWSPVANTSAALAEALGFEECRPLQTKAGEGKGAAAPPREAHLGVIAECEATPLGELAARVARALDARDVRVTESTQGIVRRVAVVAGSAKGLQEAARTQGAEAVIAGEVGHHAALESAQVGLATIEVGHAESERPAMARLAGLMRERFGGEVELLVSEEGEGGRLRIGIRDSRPSGADAPGTGIRDGGC